MPCKSCKITVSSGRKVGKNVWYCLCGSCNYCHVTGIRHMHWYVRAKSEHKWKDVQPCQSHGGNSWIPDADRKHPKPHGGAGGS